MGSSLFVCCFLIVPKPFGTVLYLAPTNMDSSGRLRPALTPPQLAGCAHLFIQDSRRMKNIRFTYSAITDIKFEDLEKL